MKTEPDRRILARGRSLLAFEVGVGSTFTARAIVWSARMRREAEGRGRRPVIVAPPSMRAGDGEQDREQA